MVAAGLVGEAVGPPLEKVGAGLVTAVDLSEGVVLGVPRVDLGVVGLLMAGLPSECVEGSGRNQR